MESRGNPRHRGAGPLESGLGFGLGIPEPGLISVQGEYVCGGRVRKWQIGDGITDVDWGVPFNQG